MMRSGSRLGLWTIGIVATVAAVLLIGWVLLVELPSLLSDVPGLTVAERTTSENSIRGTLTQLLGGIFVAGGLLFTARTFQLTRESQITERYTTAITQIGDEALPVRLGGIYALERIARDSNRDAGTITAVLCAFVRAGDEAPPMTAPAADIRAAVEVVGRLPGSDKRRDLDLRGAKLTLLELADAHLAGADLTDAVLVRAVLPRADLRGATLNGVNLTRATITGANLSGNAHITLRADLSGLIAPGVDFRDCELDGAIMVGAVLTGADLRGATLVGADLSSATIEGDTPRRALVDRANFQNAIFDGTQLRGIDFRAAVGLTSAQKDVAIGDAETQWPPDLT